MDLKSAAVAGAATVIMLVAACSENDPTTIAEGDVVLVATPDHDERPLKISAVEEDGEVTGEFQMSGHTIAIECADTDTDGIVIVGGTVTAGEVVPPGELLGLIIREGDPDRVLLIGNDTGAESCTELLEDLPEVPPAGDSLFTDLEDGDDIKTG